jgi:hypothetical protein
MQATVSGVVDKGCSLNVEVCGYAYEERPIASASRSQQLFYSLARRVAAIPALPGKLTPSRRNSSEFNDELNEELNGATLEGDDGLMNLKHKDDILAKFVELGEIKDGHPEDNTSPLRIPALDRITTPPPSRHNSSTPTITSMTSNVEPTTRLPPAHNAWPIPFAYSSSDLPHLHNNLNHRLLPFFARKLPARRVKVSIYPALIDRPSKTTLLVEEIIYTELGGDFTACIHISDERLTKFRHEVGLEEGHELSGTRIRVVTELLGDESEALVTATDEVSLNMIVDGGVRCISDIDDTIKVSKDRSLFQ